MVERFVGVKVVSEPGGQIHGQRIYFLLTQR